MGDFNIDLLKYATESNTGEFYDLLCSYSFRPLILQPTRVTSKTATLIDNIFINDISCHSIGGNVTSSISDQFSQIDILRKSGNKTEVKYARDFQNFNKRESDEELSNLDWSDTIDERNGTEICYQSFYLKIEKLRDEMAPYRKMTKKEIRLEQRPWITQGLLISMRVQDKLYKRCALEKDEQVKNDTSVLYKRYRNLIVSLLKRSKQNYEFFFIQNQSNAKKTQERTSNIDMDESLNDFFVNIGASVEAKIPQSKKHFSSYLVNPNNKSIFVNPCTEYELRMIIGSLKSSKACGPNSISTNLLIEFSDLF